MNNITTTPATARTDVDILATAAPAGMSPTTIRRSGLVLAAGTATWAVANLVWGFTPDTETGVKVTDLTGLAFQVGIMALLHVQMATRAGWTPFDGMEAKGWPKATIIRGKVVMRDDEIVLPSQGEPVRFLETLAS